MIREENLIYEVKRSDEKSGQRRSYNRSEYDGREEKRSAENKINKRR